jgi:hypothetical protein
LAVFTKSCFSLALFTAVTAASGQEAPQASADNSTIVVTGVKDSKQAIRNFVRDLTPAASNARISRLERAVCPVAFGIPGVQAAAVASRLRIVAKSVGLAVAGANCEPNVMVIVTADKKVLLEQMRKDRPDFLVSLSSRKIRALENSPGAAAAWQLADSDVNADGAEIPWDRKTGWNINSTITPASRLTVTARPRFYASIVIVERGALAGLTTTQLGDYAALTAYTGADPARLRSSSAPTILRVLDAPMGTAVPVTMTTWDYGFLSGFYTSGRDLRTPSQRSSIARTIAENIETAAHE